MTTETRGRLLHVTGWMVIGLNLAFMLADIAAHAYGAASVGSVAVLGLLWVQWFTGRVDQIMDARLRNAAAQAEVAEHVLAQMKASNSLELTVEAMAAPKGTRH